MTSVTGDWVKADMWHRRELLDGTYLAVSLQARGIWQWRRHVRATGKVMATGMGVTAAVAMLRADQSLAETYSDAA
jgi:ferredoxin-NADP reductase